MLILFSAGEFKIFGKELQQIFIRQEIILTFYESLWFEV